MKLINLKIIKQYMLYGKRSIIKWLNIMKTYDEHQHDQIYYLDSRNEGTE
jgi:hypothetical protein